MKKIIKLAIFIFGLSLFTPVSGQAAGFRDVSKEYTFYDEVMYLSSKGYITGYSDSNFKASDTVTRAQAAIMIGRAIGLNGDPRNTKFNDVTSNVTGSGFIASAVEKGIISGFTDETFRPNTPVTRGQMAIFLDKAYTLKIGRENSFNDVSSNMVAYQSILNVSTVGIANGYSDGTYRPNQPVTRGQFSAFLARTIEPAFILEPIEGDINLTPINYQAIKINDKLYGYYNLNGGSSFSPYVTNFTELSINGEKEIVAPSVIDVRRYSEDTFGTQSGLFNFLQIVAGEYTIVPSKNPFLDGDILLTNASGNWTTTNKDLDSSSLKLGYETIYVSANNMYVNQWYEYNGEKFRNPSIYTDSEDLIEQDIFRFVYKDTRSAKELYVSLNDLLEQWGINKSISHGKEGDLTYIEIK